MDEHDIAVRFWNLHAGRHDVWGAVEGRCVREILTVDHFVRHLFGDGSIGIYPLIPLEDPMAEDDSVECIVTWGASDIDRGDDMMVLARNLRSALAALGVHSFIERSKGKGYHVIAYSEQWVPAEWMRRTFLVAHQVADVPPTEVYPKQERLSKDKPLGNFLNLSFAHAWVQQGKRVILDPKRDWEPMSLEQFIEEAETSLNDESVFEAAAKLWVPPPPPRELPKLANPYDGSLESVARKMGGLAWTIFNDGPLEGRDRSSTLVRFAHLCQEDGLEADEALALLKDLDLRHGKFQARDGSDRELVKIIRKAYA